MFFGLGLANLLIIDPWTPDEYGSSKKSLNTLTTFAWTRTLIFFPHHFAIQHLVVHVLYSKHNWNFMSFLEASFHPLN